MITERLIKLHATKKKLYLDTFSSACLPFYTKPFYNTPRVDSLSWNEPIYHDRFYKKQLIMSEILIRNPTYHSYKGINMDRLLSFCRYYEDNYYVYVDNWIIKKYNKQIFYEKEHFDTPFVSNDYEKLSVGYHLLYIFNQTPDELINWVNYHDLGLWYGNNKDLIMESTLCNEAI